MLDAVLCVAESIIFVANLCCAYVAKRDGELFDMALDLFWANIMALCILL